jgi:hypothetical protein
MNDVRRLPMEWRELGPDWGNGPTTSTATATPARMGN